MLNMLTMAIEFEGMSEEYQEGLNYVNTAFLTIFTLECVIKMLGLRHYYFKEPWNVFDFVVVVVSLLSKLNRHFYRAAWNATRSYDEISVRPSIRLSVCLSVKRVHCDKTEEKSVQIFIPCDRQFSLVF